MILCELKYNVLCEQIHENSWTNPMCSQNIDIRMQWEPHRICRKIHKLQWIIFFKLFNLFLIPFDTIAVPSILYWILDGVLLRRHSIQCSPYNFTWIHFIFMRQTRQTRWSHLIQIHSRPSSTNHMCSFSLLTFTKVLPYEIKSQFQRLYEREESYTEEEANHRFDNCHLSTKNYTR